ncbi:MAG: zinc ribbon domain-containing protein [Aquabacterium sp.]|uniref:FmdB family zinc ribbon protein n=1 Tax=Aquabacterium sp. TaxID=1872578 RepID=UPI00120D5092|nr:FmdB family zinc ribbon protein [Aquabacterium sp.]TAK93224.1 MAG: zinc ribbon domain-containing protein [Aquabacterium sp.]
MPIYAYRCESCGHAKDVLQKMSDPVLTTCPACGAESFQKQITAAGFQLKGSGWYVTDFRGGSGGGTSAPATGAATAAAATESSAAPAASSDSGSSSGGDTAAGGCGSSCACH